MKLTARQTRLLTNAAIDSMPSTDEDDSTGYSSSTGKRESPNKIDESDRRRHRQLLRRTGIKPNHKIADRLRKDEVKIPDGNKVMRKGSPKMGRGQSAKATNFSDLMHEESFINTVNSGNIKISNKARRLMELGGY